VFATSSTNYEWKLFLNPTVAGSDAVSWQDITNSSLQYDVTRDNTNTLTGGYVVAGGYGSSSAPSKQVITGTISNFLTLGATAAGTQDEYVLGVANVDGNGGTVYGGITIGEYY